MRKLFLVSLWIVLLGIVVRPLPALPPTLPCGTYTGTIIDPMEAIKTPTTGGWEVGSGGGGSGSLSLVPGYPSGDALKLNYQLGTTKGAYVQFLRIFDPPIDLSAGDHLRFLHQGTLPNSIEVGLISTENIPLPNYFASAWERSTHTPWWTYATWDLKDFFRENPPGTFHPFPDLIHVKGIFISIVNKTANEVGGTGSFTVDDLQILNLASRTTPSTSDTLAADPTAIDKAADWIAARQQPSKLLASWPEQAQLAQDPLYFAWLYDQALALLVLSTRHSANDMLQARDLVSKLHNLQNSDGSWYAGYDYVTSAATGGRDIGPIAWLIYALVRYRIQESNLSQGAAAFQDAREAAKWMATQQRADGSMSDITEWNLDSWWAFQVTGYQAEADQLRNYLLDHVWDPQMGRFKSSGTRYQIFLDNQTWGAPLLRAWGRDADARKALSYAYANLTTTSSSGTPCGLDGAGPFAPWNEGTGQYIAQRGANSQHYWDQLVSQQAVDGGMPNSPDPITPLHNDYPSCPVPSEINFCAYIVWLSRWHGIAPTAWLYFAGTGGPFAPLEPEIQVEAPQLANIPDGGTYDMGTTTVGIPITKTITVGNIGTDDLTISVDRPTVGTDFEVTPFGATTIPPGGSTTFDLTCKAERVVFTTSSVSFPNNDADENPFLFYASCVVTPAPAPEIVVEAPGPIDIPDGGTYDLGTTAPGISITRMITVRNTGTDDLTLSANKPATTGTCRAGNFGVTTIPPNASTRFRLTCDASEGGIQSATISFGNNDSDENPFNFNVTYTVSGPEIEVEAPGALLIHDGSTYDMGETMVGTPITHAILVRNIGAANLILRSPKPVVSGQFAASNFGMRTIAPGGFTTFTLTCTASSEGEKPGTISFGNNDGNENPFNFSVICNVNAAPTINCGTPPVGTVGRPYRYTCPVTGHPTPTITITGAQLPAGLRWNNDARNIRIVGVPLVGRTTGMITVEATNAFGSASDSFVIEIESPPRLSPSRNYFQTATPTLTWNRISWAVNYEIEIDDSPAFRSLVIPTITVPGSELEYTLTTALSNGRYYWRVRPVSATGQRGPWGGDSFIMDVP